MAAAAGPRTTKNPFAFGKPTKDVKSESATGQTDSVSAAVGGAAASTTNDLPFMITSTASRLNPKIIESSMFRALSLCIYVICLIDPCFGRVVNSGKTETVTDGEDGEIHEDDPSVYFKAGMDVLIPGYIQPPSVFMKKRGEKGKPVWIKVRLVKLVNPEEMEWLCVDTAGLEYICAADMFHKNRFEKKEGLQTCVRALLFPVDEDYAEMLEVDADVYVHMSGDTFVEAKITKICGGIEVTDSAGNVHCDEELTDLMVADAPDDDDGEDSDGEEEEDKATEYHSSDSDDDAGETPLVGPLKELSDLRRIKGKEVKYLIARHVTRRDEDGIRYVKTRHPVKCLVTAEQADELIRIDQLETINRVIAHVPLKRLLSYKLSNGCKFESVDEESRLLNGGTGLDSVNAVSLLAMFDRAGFSNGYEFKWTKVPVYTDAKPPVISDELKYQKKAGAARRKADGEAESEPKKKKVKSDKVKSVASTAAVE